MHNDKKLEREVGLARIEVLFGLASERAKEGTAEGKRLARRYLKLATEISTHYKIPLPKARKLQMCKKCGNMLIPGLNCTVRLSSTGFIAYRCECGNTSKFFIAGKGGR